MKSGVPLIAGLAVLAALTAWALIRILMKKETSIKTGGVLVANLCVIEAMALFLIARIVRFEQQGFNSAPSCVVLVETVYFLVPLGIFNLVCFFMKRLLRR